MTRVGLMGYPTVGITTHSLTMQKLEGEEEDEEENDEEEEEEDADNNDK